MRGIAEEKHGQAGHGEADAALLEARPVEILGVAGDGVDQKAGLGEAGPVAGM